MKGSRKIKNAYKFVISPNIFLHIFTHFDICIYFDFQKKKVHLVIEDSVNNIIRLFKEFYNIFIIKVSPKWLPYII